MNQEEILMQEEFKKQFSNQKPIQNQQYNGESQVEDSELKDLKRMVKTGLKYSQNRRYLHETPKDRFGSAGNAQV